MHQKYNKYVQALIYSLIKTWNNIKVIKVVHRFGCNSACEPEMAKGLID